MCGIAGIIGSTLGADALRAALEGMRVALSHRGPDGCGLWMAEDGAAGFAHTRLAVIDLSENAAQPMVKQGCCLVFNGEIYNYGDLQPGAVSDTRALLETLLAEGADGLSRLAGMFACGFFDGRDGSLLLARDPLGIKPLYYADTPSGFVFASEVRAVLASGMVPAHPDPVAAAAFFQTGSVPEPLTPIRELFCLPAHHDLKRFADGRVVVAGQKSVQPAPEVSTLEEALAESCRRHLVSDVPVGVFLSGGVDSAAVARMAMLNGQLAEAFCLVFEEGAFSEETAARSTAKKLGLHLHITTLSQGEAKSLFSEFLGSQDQPSIDGFNTFCISKFANEVGMKVVLSGLGGDEAFGGYPTFRIVPRIAEWGSVIPLTLGKCVGGVLERIGHWGKLRRVGSWLQNPRGLDAAFRLIRGIFSPMEARVVMQHFGCHEFYEFPPEELLTNGCEDPQVSVSHLESRLYMRNQLLRDSDTMSMAHGLELRVPLVDARLWAFLEGMSPQRRFAPKKLALRQAVPGLDDLLVPGPKRGFTLPLQLWLNESWDSFGDLAELGRHLDLEPWARKMAILSWRSFWSRI